MGLSTSGGSESGEQRLAVFFDRLAAKGVDVKDLPARIRNPIRFIPPWGGSVAYGFEAVILADICDAILAARKVPGALHQQQLKIADRCEILMRGFARVGIVALVDEATGYQFDRPNTASSTVRRLRSRRNAPCTTTSALRITRCIPQGRRAPT